MAGLIILNEEKLRKLASVIYHKEAEAIKNIQFNSEPERAKYLSNCKSNYESIIGLLDAGIGPNKEIQDDEIKRPIAHDIFSYIKICINNALQAVRNYTLRMNYLNKIKEHSNTLREVLTKLDRNNMENVKSLASTAAEYKNAMLEYTKEHQRGASSLHLKIIKEGETFEQLLKRYQAKLGFRGPFEKLKEVEKLQVYEKIIEDSGRGKPVATKLSTAFGVAGIVALIFAAGSMVWDIYSSEHKLETIARDVLQIASAVGGAMLGDVVATALQIRLAGVAMSSLIVGMVGIAIGFAGSYILGEFTGWLVDLIFNSGSDKAFSTDGHRCYVAPMPDGVVLARQIDRQVSVPA